MTPASDGASTSAVLETGTVPATDLRTILLLDPVTLFLRLEETILQRKDWTIHCARTAEEALDALMNEHVDLLVMDHVLPDTTGDEFIRAVRANPRLRATGILVLTARGAKQAIERCLEAGANGVLFKPVTRQDLCARVEDLLYISARRHVRTLVRLKVDATSADGAFFAHTVNVSAGGMLLESATPLEKGDTLDLCFVLPGDGEPLKMKARVVRLAETGAPGRYGIGLAFEGVSDRDRERIEGFVSETRGQTGVFVTPAV